MQNIQPICVMLFNIELEGDSTGAWYRCNTKLDIGFQYAFTVVLMLQGVYVLIRTFHIMSST